MTQLDPFGTQAGAYARFRPAYPAHVFEQLAARAPTRHAALDCGAGSGQATQHLARLFDLVAATDVSASQLKQAPRRPNVGYLRTRVEALCLAPHTFDLIIATQAVHWFDLPPFYEEVHRVSRAGAVVCFMGYGRAHLAGALGSHVAAFYDAMFGRYFNAERRYVEENYRTLPFPFDEISGPEFHMDLNWRLSDLDGFVETWSSLQEYRRDTERDPLPDFMHRARALWGGDDNEVRPARFDGFMRLGIVRPAADG